MLKTFKHSVITLLTILFAAVLVYAYGLWQGWYGQPEQAGVISTIEIPRALIESRSASKAWSSPIFIDFPRG